MSRGEIEPITIVLIRDLQLFVYLCSARPNLFVGHVANSALFSKWYYEITIDYVEQASHMPLHFRVGWASSKG